MLWTETNALRYRLHYNNFYHKRVKQLATMPLGLRAARQLEEAEALRVEDFEGDPLTRADDLGAVHGKIDALREWIEETERCAA